MSVIRGVWAGVSVALVVTALGCSSGGSDRSEILVFAATSLIDAMDEIERAFDVDHDINVAINSGGSQELAQQIARGAPADIFISAGQFPMSFLADERHVEPDIVELLSNELVLVTPADGIPLRSMEELTGDAVERVAIANPEMAPAGSYAQESLTRLGLWDRLQGKLVMGADVRVTLAYVESGNADVALVYRTDAMISDEVTTLDIVPPDSYSRIVYPAAIVRRSEAKEAAGVFLDFLQGRSASAIFHRHGFEPLAP